MSAKRGGNKTKGGRDRSKVSVLKARQAAAVPAKGTKAPGSTNKHKSYPR